MSEKHPADCTGPFADGKLCPVHGRTGTTVCVDVSVKQPEEVKCVVCEKLEPRRHPGHFMCGNPICREKIVERVRSVESPEIERLRKLARDLYSSWLEAYYQLDPYWRERHGHEYALKKYEAPEYAWLTALKDTK